MDLNQSIDNDALERISALADGQLRGDDFTRAVEAAVGDPQARAAWHAYHVVGDVLRFGEAAGRSNDRGFAERFALRLKQEAAPNRPHGEATAIERVADEGDWIRALGRINTKEAANAPVFRWKAAAGIATIVAVAAVGWNLLGTTTPSDAPSQLALVPAESSADPGSSPSRLATAANLGEPRRMIRDPRLDELLAAHEQSGGVSVLQMPAGFLRNATFEGRGR